MRLFELAFHRGLGPSDVATAAFGMASQFVVAMFGVSTEREVFDLSPACSALEADHLAGVWIGPYLSKLSGCCGCSCLNIAVGESLPELELLSCGHVRIVEAG